MANSEKDKPKRTCIDCHFFMVIPQLDCGEPPMIGVDEDDNPVYCDMKNRTVDPHTRDFMLNNPRNARIHFADNFCGCFHEFWVQADQDDYGKLYDVIVETDRSDCTMFFEYHPSMRFEAAGRVQDREILLSLNKKNVKGNKVEAILYVWNIKDTRDIFCNGQHIVKLPALQFKLFKSLYKRSGKYVKNETLEKCWGDEIPNYKEAVPTTMSKLNTKLEEGLTKNHIEIKSRVIEPKQENKKNVAYKLVT